MLPDETQESNEPQAGLRYIWTEIINTIDHFWRRLTGYGDSDLPLTINRDVITLNYEPFHVDPIYFESFQIEPLHFESVPLFRLEEEMEQQRQELMRELHARETRLHHSFNAIALNLSFFQPEIFIPRRHYWEEEMQSWFHQNHYHPTTVVERQLVELEETENARKLEAYDDVAIDERFICGITHEIMTHPIYDKNNPHQKMDFRALLEWLKEHNTHPFTRSELHISNLEYDERLKAEIDLFVAQTLEGSINRLCVAKP
ncbi:MAG: hypothetical protein P1U39_06750 [Legionellaceae bacterium]|nr:hypothetical protein [Legionellaceae bacterium]